MTFQDDLDRILAEDFSYHYDDSGEPVDLPGPTITVKHHAAYIPVSTEQALDAGLITEEQAREQGWTPYVLPPVSWRARMRFRWWAWRERVGRRVGGWLAGVDLTERDDY